MNIFEVRIGFTLSTIGDIIIGYVALSVHKHILKERSIDEDVLIFMKKERILGFIGIIFIIVGYLLEIIGI